VKKGVPAENEFYVTAGVKATRFTPEMHKSAILFPEKKSAGKQLLRFPHFRHPWRSP
jgi:hypothetical protein